MFTFKEKNTFNDIMIYLCVTEIINGIDFFESGQIPVAGTGSLLQLCGDFIQPLECHAIVVLGIL